MGFPSSWSQMRPSLSQYLGRDSEETGAKLPAKLWADSKATETERVLGATVQ